ncbi:hypothetical protein [Microcella sp.]
MGVGALAPTPIRPKRFVITQVKVLMLPTSSLLVITTLALGLGLAGASSVDAASIWNVEPRGDAKSISDGSFQFSVEQGEVITGSLTVTNVSAAPRPLRLVALGASNAAETGELEFRAAPEEGDDDSAAAWVTLPEAQVTVAPGASVDLAFVVDVPPTAAVGHHTLAIVAALGTGPDLDVVAHDDPSLARVDLLVAGQLSAEFQLSGVTTSFVPAWNPFDLGSLDVGATITNTGNVRLDVEPRFAVSTVLGVPMTAASAGVISDLLPGESVRLDTTIDGVAPLGIIVTSVQVTSAGDELEVPLDSASGGEGGVGPTPAPSTTGNPATSGAEPEPGETPTPTATPEATVTPTPTPQASETPGAGAGGGTAAGDGDDAGAEADGETGPLAYPSVSQTSTAAAVSWSVIVLLAFVVAGFVVIRRSLERTRQAIHADIARFEAAQQSRSDGPAPSPTSSDQ